MQQHDTIQKALTCLENANYAGYFGEMDKIIEKFASPHRNTYTGLKNNYLSFTLAIPSNFPAQLEVFTSVIKDELTQMNIGFPHELIKPKSSVGWYVGREADLEAIEQCLFDANNSLLLLVNGQGGIGKTTLALAYYDKQKTRYQHMAWLLAGESILNTILGLDVALDIQFPPAMPYKERLEVLVEKMQTLPAPCLLVLDNANNLTDLDVCAKILQRCKNFHFLFTSRGKHEDTANIEVKGLEPHLALQVFKKYYKNHDASEDALVLKVYEAVSRNTLVLEVLAKNLHNINTRLQVHYPLPAMLHDIQQKGVLSIQQAEKPISVDWHEWEMERALPETFLREMYNLQKSPLSETEKALLSVFSVLPTENIPFAVLQKLLEKEQEKKDSKDFMAQVRETPNTKQPETLDKTIISLEAKGWIEDEHQKNAFKCHTIVQTIIRNQHDARLWADCKGMVEKLEFLFKTDGTLYLKNLNHNEAPKYAPMAESVLQYLDVQNHTIGGLGVYLSDYYQSVGKLQEAFLLLESASIVFENLGNTRNYCICLNRMGDIDRALGNLAEALSLFEKTMQIDKEAHQKNPQDTNTKRGVAIAYEKLGNTYSSLGDLEKALQFFEESLKLSKELHQKEPTNVRFKRSVAIAYASLGDTYNSLGDLEKALQFFEENLKLSKELHQEKLTNAGFKEDIAIAYSRLGMMHLSLDDLQQASTNFYASLALMKGLAEENPLDIKIQANYAESTVVCWAVDTLAGKEASPDVLQQASSTFADLYEKSKKVNLQKKVALIARMQESGADLKALVVEMSRF